MNYLKSGKGEDNNNNINNSSVNDLLGASCVLGTLLGASPPHVPSAMLQQLPAGLLALVFSPSIHLANLASLSSLKPYLTLLLQHSQWLPSAPKVKSNSLMRWLNLPCSGHALSSGISYQLYCLFVWSSPMPGTRRCLINIC